MPNTLPDTATVRVLPAKCCAHCTHGRPVPDPHNLRTMYRCKAAPPTALVAEVVNQNGQVIGTRAEAHWPILAAESECDAFQSRLAN